MATIEIGDAVLNTDGIEKQVEEMIDRLQRTLDAARAAWNESKKEAEKVA